MRQVILACLPGVAILIAFFGLGVISNLIIAIVAGLAFEAWVLKLRGRPIAFYLKDYSAVLTAVLLAIAIPPFAPWWLIVVGLFFSIVVAKHLYGGLGYNPFNPAMVGYVVLLISFPTEMTQWAAPIGALQINSDMPSLFNLPFAFQQVFTDGTLDAYSAATPLDSLKQRGAMTLTELYQNDMTLHKGRWAGLGWEWVNVAFLTGGIYLLYKKVFTWHAPVAMLVAIAILSSLFYGSGGSESHGSPLFHLLSGATMFGAFFIITDPVTSAVSRRGRLVYGAGIGVLIYVIRIWGNYPDAVAFACLLYTSPSPRDLSTSRMPSSA